MSSGELTPPRPQSGRPAGFLHAVDETLYIDGRFQYDESDDRGHAYLAVLGSSGTEHCAVVSSFDSASAAAQLATLLNRFAYELEALELGRLPELAPEPWPELE
jgi:hypothetical protein